MDFTYFNAVYTVENALAKVTDEKGMKRVERFLKQGPCPDCGGSRLSERARSPRIRGLSLPDVCRMPLSALRLWVDERARLPARGNEAAWPRASAIRSGAWRPGCWSWAWGT